PLEEAEEALSRFAAYYNCHRLSGAIGWLTPGERFDGTPFTDRGFENIPALEHLQDWLAQLMRAAYRTESQKPPRTTASRENRRPSRRRQGPRAGAADPRQRVESPAGLCRISAGRQACPDRACP